MKLSKKDKRLLKELLHQEIYAQEQIANVTYDLDRVQRVKALLLRLSA